MRELSLFSGAGGGLLGSLLLGWEPIGYVEFNDYCQRVIRQRIDDGILPNAPIFGDIRTFLSEGYAAAYTGMVDVISGGFPCQPFSVAGKRAGADDPRNMWPATIATVRAVRPRFCFFENVPGLLNSGYFGRIVADLAESGYGVRWRCLSAAELGAPHKRDRLWIVAHTNGARSPESHSVYPDSDEQRHDSPSEQSGRTKPRVAECGRSNVGHTSEQGLSNGRGAQMGQSRSQPQPQRSGGEMAYTNGKRLNESRPIGSTTQYPGAQPCCDSGQWWQVEPDVGRVVDELAFRVDRLKALGNGQVPSVAATAWHLLTEDI